MTQPLKIIPYRRKIVDTIKRELPQFAQVVPHGGRFSEDDLKKIMMATPAAFVSILGAPNGEDIATAETPLRLAVAVYVVSTDRGVLEADEVCWNFAEGVAALAKYNWFSSPVWPAMNIGIENLWSSSIDNKRCSICAVTWDCDIRLGADIAAIKIGLTELLAGAPYEGSIVVNEGIRIGAPSVRNGD